MNVIFLDYNGVLDTNDNMDVINLDNLQRLKYIVDETNSKVVLTTSKKNSFYITGVLNQKLQEDIKLMENSGIEIIGITPKANTREEEIEFYLRTHLEVENFCIIDDDYEMEKFADNLVKLPNQIEDGQMGLDEKYMNMAIKILKRI